MSTEEQKEVEAIAKAVGFAISEWGQLEHILCSIYAAAIRAPIYSLAHAAFYSIVSFHAKLRAADVSYRMAFRGQVALLDEWNTLRKLARSLSEKRNGLAHGAVRIIYSEPKIVGWFPFWNGTEVTKGCVMDGKLYIGPAGIAPHFSSHDIRQMEAEFEDAAAKGYALYEKVTKHLHDSGKSWNHERL